MAKTLRVGVQMDGSTDEASIELPEDWDSMSPEDQKAWADEALDVHVWNNVDSWHYVEES